MAYKLVEYAGKPRLKLSTKKISYLGEKQVYRLFDTQGLFAKDLLALREETWEEICQQACPEHSRREGASQAEPLLHRVMERGKLCTPLPSLTEARETFLADFRRLPDAYKALRHPSSYPVALTPRLASFQEQAVRAIREQLREKSGGHDHQ
jgi:nicotinate phosphoribosyltransferase